MTARLSRTPFGEHSLVTLGTERSHVSFIPEAAGYVHQVRLGGRDLLAHYEDAAALSRNKYSFSLSILPFPNRLAEGSYTWAGQDYSFEINDPETGTALHGFGLGTAFRLTSVRLGADRVQATLRYLSSSAANSAYPFTVQFDLTLALDLREERFTWLLAATNLETIAVPVGMCWHPYFVLPEGTSKWHVEMPPNQHVELRKALPTGRLTHGLSPKQPTPIDLTWDDCFRLSDLNSRDIILRGPDYGLSLKQSGDVRYTQLFVPPMQDSLAIEPMSCGVNAFRDGEEEVRLGPGKSRLIGMEIGVKNDSK